METGTWNCVCPTSPSTYDPSTLVWHRKSHPRFLHCNVSTEMQQELAKFESLLVETNFSFEEMSTGAPVPIVDRMEDE